ncbi:hypothetical protein B0T24DRAFT_651017 [Lasiosphaeria ovina]|uniref:feruloyl esterase n=1 Tax=Lasiosphaeria ovina TaxID=92902 RepID=A0AAE0K3R2_9PEZI|nr:hypothetical protein B0T24DRAFT_651017 [Lasiosphaeria ovina]
MDRRPNFLVALALLVLSCVGAVKGESSAGCGKTPTITGKQYSMTNRPYRLVFTWHQLGGSAQKIVDGKDTSRGGALPYYGLNAIANNSAIFVVPQGLNAGWGNQGGEDVTFFDQLAKTVAADVCVDTRLRFSTGFSYGGAMSYALACARPKDIRAVAVISGSQLSGCTGGNDPVAYYGQHGTSDSVLNVSRGRQLRDRFVRNNGCTAVSETQPSGGRSVKTVYQGCNPGYPVTWKDGSVIFAPKNTWDFFTQFS